MFRILFATIILAATLSMSGCILGPCGGGQCNDCDGCGHGEFYAAGPRDSFRNWRRSLTCGSGCGEVYYDEWSSTPPDCVDPCPQFAGGCGARCGGGCADCGCGIAGCRGGCGFQPLRAVGRLVIGLYGKRFCGDCGHDWDNCGCNGAATTDIGITEGGCASGNCGRPAAGTPQLAESGPRHSMARQQAMARQSRARTNDVYSTEGQVIHPAEPPQNFYRRATRLPQGPKSLQR